MKKLFLILFTIFSFSKSFSQQAYYDVTQGDGYGIRLWSDDWYKISMGNSSDYHYGPVTGYSIKTNMTSQTDRGWVWGVKDQTPVIAMSTIGDMQINRNLVALGNVGIGTTSPKGPLHVKSNGGTTYGSIFEGTNSYNYVAVAGADSYDAGIVFTEGDASVYSNRRWLLGHDASADLFRIYEYNKSDGTTGVNSHRLVINSDGNVGIGTTSPGSKLEIQTTTNSTALRLHAGGNGDHFFQFDSNAQPLYILQNSTGTNKVKLHSNGNTYFNGGNVGIGTTTPDDALEVNGGITVSGFSRGTSNSSWGSLSGKPVYTMLSSRSDGIDNSLHGFGSVQTTHFESPYIYGYNSVGNMIVFGSVSAANRNPATGLTPRMMIDMNNGNVGIGTTDPGSFKLAVEGKIGAREVNVTAASPWPDYVFEEDYDLRTLEETKDYISENKHLPEIPSASEIGENGIDIGDMNMKLLKKIEELTLHMIRIDEELQNVKVENQKLKAQFGKK